MSGGRYGEAGVDLARAESARERIASLVKASRTPNCIRKLPLAQNRIPRRWHALLWRMWVSAASVGARCSLSRSREQQASAWPPGLRASSRRRLHATIGSARSLLRCCSLPLSRH